MLVLGFPDSERGARELASELGSEVEIIDVHRFPDGESRLRLPEVLPEHVAVYRSLDQPNEKLVELMLALRAAREMGTTRITLVAPYLCYMRQDSAFHPGEVVSQRIIGRFLAELCDALITVDPHLHRVKTLAEAAPGTRAVALSAAPAMGAFLASRAEKPLLVGPDQESEQWVQSVARIASLEHVVATKIRRGDRKVAVQLPERDYSGQPAVLVDDLASTGRTLVAAAQALLGAGASRVDVLVTHALFVGDALEMLRAVGVSGIWSSDSVLHPSNAFPLAPLLAKAVH